MLDPARFSLHIDARSLASRVAELAGAIQARTDPEHSVILVVMNGALVFGADLMRRMDPRYACDFLRMSSYGSEEVSSGAVELLLAPREPLKDRDVIIIDDIYDSGRTMAEAVRLVMESGAREAVTVAMLAKNGGASAFGRVDLVGFHVPQGFYVGYGLDWDRRYRGLPDIHRKDIGDE